MWVYCNSCMGYKRARVLIDHAARRTSCAECGHEIEDGVYVAENETVRVADPINTEPKNDSSVDLLSRFPGNSQNPASDSVSVATSQPQNASTDYGLSLTLGTPRTRRGSDPLFIATTETNTASSDGFLLSNLGNLQQNRSFDPLSISMANMSQGLGLPATVENKAYEIFKLLELCSKGNEIQIDVHSAACIYIACRFTNDQTRSLTEISSVLFRVTVPEIRNAVEFIADRLGFNKDKLLKIKAVDFMKRFCSKLGMNSEEVKAAEEIARNYDVINISHKGPESVAAAVLYVIGRISYEKKLCKDITKVTRVPGSRIDGAYQDLYPNLLAIIPNWFANANDLKNLNSP